MGITAKLAMVEKKFAWSFLGFILAAIFGGIALYTEFLRKDNPVITYEILSNTKILDVKEDVTGLSISYSGEDIRKARKTLSVLLIKIGNEGRSPILKSYYDNNSPLGLSINQGEVIKAEITAGTTDYLRQNASISIRGSSSVEFNQIIIEPNESLTAKLLVLNPEQYSPTIVPKGKIAGVKQFLLIDRTSDQTKETFWMKVISGSLWVQASRTVIYTIVFFILIAIIIAPTVYISEKKAGLKRSRVIRQFKSVADSVSNELNTDVYQFYKENGLTVLKRIIKILANERQLKALLKKYDVRLSDTELVLEREEALAMASVEGREDLLTKPNLFTAETILKLRLVTKTGEGYTRNEEKIKAMDEFVQFAKTKKA